DLIDNEQKSSYNKKVKNNGNELYPKKGESSDDTITNNPSNETSNDVNNNDDINNDSEDKKERLINKLGSNIIDEWLNSLRKMKKMNISSVNLNSNNNTVLVTEEGDTLILHLYSDDEKGQKPKYQTQYYTRNEELYIYIQLSGEGNGNGSSNNKGSQNLKHQAQYRKGKKRLHKEELLPIKENLRLFKGPPERLSERPPEGPPEKLGLVKENPEFKKFEVSSDNESNEKIHKKDEKKYFDDKVVNLNKDLHKILQFIHKLLTCPPTRDIFSSNHIRVPFIVKDKNKIKNTLHKLVDNIFNFITGNLEDLDLMLQISLRIYRLLQIYNGNWVLLDVFEEIISIFFKSKMKVSANFEIWLNLIRTGQMADYKKGSTMYEEEKKFMKKAKLNIVKAYFNGVDENLKDFIADKDGSANDF
ncbi:hypothetical protein C1646_763782, partial [Rhizophagus diaphanus]